MAKYRFPGKALKLNNRKRVKYHWENEKSSEELRVLQIKSGLSLFRHIFGESDEDDFDGFELRNPGDGQNRKGLPKASREEKYTEGFSVLRDGKVQNDARSQGEVEKEEEMENNETTSNKGLAQNLLLEENGTVLCNRLHTQQEDDLETNCKHKKSKLEKRLIGKHRKKIEPNGNKIETDEKCNFESEPCNINNTSPSERETRSKSNKLSIVHKLENNETISEIRSKCKSKLETRLKHYESTLESSLKEKQLETRSKYTEKKLETKLKDNRDTLESRSVDNEYANEMKPRRNKVKTNLIETKANDKSSNIETNLKENRKQLEIGSHGSTSSELDIHAKTNNIEEETDSVEQKTELTTKVKQISDDAQLRERLAKKRRKLLMKDSERTAKKFVLPSVSARSSRVIKPNMRLFSDITAICTSSATKEMVDEGSGNQGAMSVKSHVKSTRHHEEALDLEEEVQKDPLCRSITLYTDAITEQFKGQVGRPPKKIVRRSEPQVKEGDTCADSSPVKGPKEDKVKEKIEKLLRSPWDERLKQTPSLPSNNNKDKGADVSKTILRKARLNLNTQTLQKIRNPSSVHFVPLSDTDVGNRKCGLCQACSIKTVCCYGVSCCETCQLSINCFVEGTFSSLVCHGGQGECQLVGLSLQERCEACWLAKVLLSCAMPNLLHDRLRKQLPSTIKDRVPTSFGRSFNVNALSVPERDSLIAEDFSSTGFGSVIDLPGGWKRKTGSEVIVISPSGEKFRSITKLEEYLKRQGINADASVLFGSLTPKALNVLSETKESSKLQKVNGKNNVVVTTLPGGWTRRIRWRVSGDKFDTYVCSPDGRTFRSSKELSAYFQRIGKVDDIHKYFPVKSSSHSYVNSSENSEASTMEPFSSSEAASEVSSDRSLGESDSEKEAMYERRTSESFVVKPQPENEMAESINNTSLPNLQISNKREKYSPVIISNFAQNFSDDAKYSLSESLLVNDQNLDAQSDEECAKSVSSAAESVLGESSAIDLNLFSDGNVEQYAAVMADGKCSDNDSQRIVLKIPKNTFDSPGTEEYSDSLRHKHKKRKKRKKHHHSKNDRKGEFITKHKNSITSKHVGNADSTHLGETQDANANTDEPLRKSADTISHRGVSITTCKLPSLVSSESLPVETLPADASSIPPLSSDSIAVEPLPCESPSLPVLSYSHPNDTWQNLISAPDDSIASAEGSQSSTEKGTFTEMSEPLRFVPASDVYELSKNSAQSFTASPCYNPNDTWQTLIIQPTARNKNNSHEPSTTEVEEVERNIETAEPTPNRLPNFTDEKPLVRRVGRPKTRGKVKKVSNFTKEPFGSGWVRKIKWDKEGVGKVAFLTSPDGQKIISSIELMAYFKKAGKPMLNLKYYFPQDLVRDDLGTINAKGTKDIYDDCVKSSPRVKDAGKLMSSTGRGRGRRVLYKLPKNKFGRRALKLLHASAVKPQTIVDGDGNSCLTSDINDEAPVHADAGPRVKHVCRSKAQVLGIPRAVFPAPEGTTEKEKGGSRKNLFSEKTKYLPVLTPRGRRILRKTVWCHKCPGCTTPNCRKCSNCLDMKKYGGPGTKKKPCVMRKCQNPFKAIKVSTPRGNLSSLDGNTSEKDAVGDKTDASVKKGDSDVLSIKLSSLQSSESDMFDDLDQESIDISRKDLKVHEDAIHSSGEKSIFVPKLTSHNSSEVKDRVDILAGKEFVPGARVNIDYWQDYDAEEMLMSGFPVITSAPLELGSLCFRCGSLGLEELLYCIWCCEGVHPFCLEEGEGPESDEQEAFWVCKKCVVCHVCGAPGQNDLLQCHDCKRHFHLECLGPTSHGSCHTSSDGSWMLEEVYDLLTLSWPMQTPLFEVSCSYLNELSRNGISLYEELERFEDSDEAPKLHTFLLPTDERYSSNCQEPESPSPEKVNKRCVYVESVLIEDSSGNLLEEGGFCLEDAFEGFDDFLLKEDTPKVEDTVHLYRDVNFDTFCKLGKKEVALQMPLGMDAEEYLAMGYSKIPPFPEQPDESSLSQVLQFLHSELFSILGYPSWPEMFEQELVPKETLNAWKEENEPTDEVKYCARCIKCEGCGNSNVVDWITVSCIKNDNQGPSDTSGETKLTPFCNRCIELCHYNNFCPICFGCYEDDDFDSKMMECGQCKKWIHSHCEGLSDESYEILSYLPDSVEYICRLCLNNKPAQWMEVVKKEMRQGLHAVVTSLSSSKSAKHLLRIDSGISAESRKPGNISHNLENVGNLEIYKPPSSAVLSPPAQKAVNILCNSPALLKQATANLIQIEQADEYDTMKYNEKLQTELTNDDIQIPSLDSEFSVPLNDTFASSNVCAVSDPRECSQECCKGHPAKVVVSENMMNDSYSASHNLSMQSTLEDHLLCSENSFQTVGKENDSEESAISCSAQNENTKVPAQLLYTVNTEDADMNTELPFDKLKEVYVSVDKEILPLNLETPQIQRVLASQTDPAYENFNDNEHENSANNESQRSGDDGALIDDETKRVSSDGAEAVVSNEANNRPGDNKTNRFTDNEPEGSKNNIAVGVRNEGARMLRDDAESNISNEQTEETLFKGDDNISVPHKAEHGTVPLITPAPTIDTQIKTCELYASSGKKKLENTKQSLTRKNKKTFISTTNDLNVTSSADCGGTCNRRLTRSVTSSMVRERAIHHQIKNCFVKLYDIADSPLYRLTFDCPAVPHILTSPTVHAVIRTGNNNGKTGDTNSADSDAVAVPLEKDIDEEVSASSATYVIQSSGLSNVSDENTPLSCDAWEIHASENLDSSHKEGTDSNAESVSVNSLLNVMCSSSVGDKVTDSQNNSDADLTNSRKVETNTIDHVETASHGILHDTTMNQPVFDIHSGCLPETVASLLKGDALSEADKVNHKIGKCTSDTENIVPGYVGSRNVNRGLSSTSTWTLDNVNNLPTVNSDIISLDCYLNRCNSATVCTSNDCNYGASKSTEDTLSIITTDTSTAENIDCIISSSGILTDIDTQHEESVHKLASHIKQNNSTAEGSVPINRREAVKIIRNRVSDGGVELMQNENDKTEGTVAILQNEYKSATTAEMTQCAIDKAGGAVEYLQERITEATLTDEHQYKTEAHVQMNQRKFHSSTSAPLLTLPRVSKDIDDDCLSSEASSFCSSDTEIESIFDDSEEPRDLQEIREKVFCDTYDSVLQFHIDITRVFETGKNVNKAQTRNCRTLYLKHMRETFPWFNVQKPNIFSLIDHTRPFPFPYEDHMYADLKPKHATSSSLSGRRSVFGRSVTPSVKLQLKGKLSPTKYKPETKVNDPRKCILCNVSGDHEPEACGRLLYLGQDEWLHVNCALWSSEVYEEEDGGLLNVYVAVSRGRQIKCSHCLERGATVGCCHKSCQATFHFLCARDSQCFFGQDKRIFCSAHVASANNQTPIEDLRVRRCVFVNMDSEKRRWRQALSSKVNVIIGSLSISNLGKMFPDLNSDDALIPVDFCCSRMFWSTKEPNRRVKYTCQTKRAYPYQDSISGIRNYGFHKTIDHGMDADVVEREIKLVKDWQKEVDRQKWAKQSRQTNIIPPHMCPLYRDILRLERISPSSMPVPTRRKLFSPVPSGESTNEDEELVRSCLENIIEHISLSPKNDGGTHADISASVNADDNEFIPGMVATDESNEMMSNIVSADDNEIISMVLRDLPVIESSAPQSPPSSGRASPLDLDFLTSYDQPLTVQDLHQQKIAVKNDDAFHGQNNSNCAVHSAKEYVAMNALLPACKNILEANGSQIKSHNLTDQSHFDSTCSIANSQSFSLSQSQEHEVPTFNSCDSTVVVSPLSLQHSAAECVTNSMHSMMPGPSSYESQFLSAFGGIGSASFVSSDNHDAHQVTLQEASFYESLRSNVLSNCSSELLELKNFLIGATKSCAVDDSAKDTNFCGSAIQTTNDSTMNCEAVAHLQAASAESIPALSTIVNGLMELEGTTQNSCAHEYLATEHDRQALVENYSEVSSHELPFSAPLPSSSSATPSSSLSSKKQVCRVLPMPSAGSRRSSSASEQSDIGTTSVRDALPSTAEKNETDCKESASTENTAADVEQKKKKIRMKRNYRTVIKKYPLRSGLRKHAPFKTFQIEINETIEIPSDDDENICRSVKRKWSSTVTDSNSADSQPEDLILPSGSKREKKRIFTATADDSPLEKSLSKNGETSEDGEGDTKEAPKIESATNNRSHKVLKFSDDHSDITVSIVNNNLCNFSKSKKRRRFKRKTVLQLDGAADQTSSSSDGFEEEASSSGEVSQSALHSNLALHIKEQSLAKSAPGDEGPYKCSKCKRLYRTRDSFTRHVETCTFEIDSSTTSEEDSEKYSDYIHQISPTAIKVEAAESPPLQSLNLLQHDRMEINTQNDKVSNLEKLEELCSSPLLEESRSRELVKEEPISENVRPQGVHRQVRIAMKRDVKEGSAKVVPSSSRISVNIPSPSSSSDVFIPPSKSPMRYSTSIKKSASPRKYTNIRLFKGKQGYQYRRASPQVVASQLQPHVLQLRSPQPQQLQQQPMQQTALPFTFTSLSDSSAAFSVQSAFPPQPFQSHSNPFATVNTGEISVASVQNPLAPVGQVVTVLSGPSIAVPHGYTLQYVGSYREADINSSPSNLLTYQTAQPVVVPPIVMAPQHTPMVVPQVVNANITYAIAASPDTFLINQSSPLVPSVQYIAQPQPASFQQEIVQPIHNTIVPFGPASIQPEAQITQAFSPIPVSVQQITPTPLSFYGHSTTTCSVTQPSESLSFGNRPQAFVAPITSTAGPVKVLPSTKTDSSPPTRPLFPQALPVSRTVATVAPAVFTSSSPVVSRPANDLSNQECVTVTVETNVVSLEDETSQNLAGIRPRPTYSYRDAMMMEPKQEKGQLKSETNSAEIQEDRASAGLKRISEDDTDSEKEEKQKAQDSKGEQKTETQSFKLVLKKDRQSGSKFNILPVDIPNIAIPSPEVKELRIKAKVSVGPKRKKTSESSQRQWGQYGKDVIYGSADTTNEPLVNEQIPNLSLNFSPKSVTVDDPSLIDKPKETTPEPYIVFELTSEDGFKVESRHVSEVWQKVFDAVAEARENLRLGESREAKGKNLSGLYMLGLTHNAVQYLLEQLPGAKDCHKYSFQFHRRPTEDDEHLETASGCARTEAFKMRSPYDIFSWLASKHRRLPLRAQIQPEEIQLSVRRATSMELPMAMRYRHLCETAREAVGVFRSPIHGRGLFCKRDIDAGEMVIEYAGQVIRSCLCDMREKYYESKGIGCYMFRIDDEIVIDATMHGNAARFINHSCDPNCYSRVVDILGKKHIIIFALRRIMRGEELTYDYKFPIEDDKIPCSCGARKCRKYLN